MVLGPPDGNYPVIPIKFTGDKYPLSSFSKRKRPSTASKRHSTHTNDREHAADDQSMSSIDSDSDISAGSVRYFAPKRVKDSPSVEKKYSKMKKQTLKANPFAHFSTTKVEKRPMFHSRVCWNGKPGSFKEIYRRVTSWMMQVGMGYATRREFKEAYVKGGPTYA